MVKEIYVQGIIGDTLIKEVMLSMAVYKTCKKCNRSFPMTPKWFNKNETSSDGFQSYC